MDRLSVSSYAQVDANMEEITVVGTLYSNAHIYQLAGITDKFYTSKPPVDRYLYVATWLVGYT